MQDRKTIAHAAVEALGNSAVDIENSQEGETMDKDSFSAVGKKRLIPGKDRENPDAETRGKMRR